MDAGGAQQFFTAPLANRRGRPYVVAPLARTVAGFPPERFCPDTAPVAPPRFSSSLTPACEKAVHKLCIAWAQHIGMPAPFPSTPVDTAGRGVAQLKIV